MRNQTKVSLQQFMTNGMVLTVAVNCSLAHENVRKKFLIVCAYGTPRVCLIGFETLPRSFYMQRIWLLGACVIMKRSNLHLQEDAIE